jgi:hypothetical protein
VVFASHAQTEAEITTRHYANCADGEDRPICYLKLAAQSGNVPDQLVKRLSARPELMEQVKLQSTVPPEENNSQRSEFDELLMQPGRLARDAADETLSLDERGVHPANAIQPLLSANKGLRSKSIYLGQITTESAAELRIRQFKRIYSLQFSPLQEPGVRQPSINLVREVLAAWEHDLRKPIQTHTDFDQERSIRELASNYARLQDFTGARRVYLLSRIDPAKIDLEIAKSAGDLTSAWRLTEQEVETTSSEPRLVTLQDLPRLAFDASDEDLISSIGAKLSEPGFADKISQHALFQSLPYLNADASSAIGASLERRNTGTGYPGWFLAKVWMIQGDTTKLNAAIDQLLPEVRRCTSYLGCASLNQLLGLLAITGRMDEVYALIGQSKATQLFAISPYPPFRAEVRYGEGVLSSLDLLISHKLKSGSYFALEGALQNCAFERMSKKRFLATSAEPDVDGAYQCMLALIEIAERAGSITAHQARYEKSHQGLKLNYEHGRHIAAFTAISLATQLSGADEERSRFLENEALRLLSDAPERAAFGAFVSLAVKRLENSGRL